jgi:predicted O-methyltransferase YrrM
MHAPCVTLFPNDIPTALSNAEATQLQELAAGGCILELGAQYGFSTIVLAGTARVVHSVDWHQGDSMAGHVNSRTDYFCNLNRYAGNNIVTHVGRFEDLLPLFAGGVFDGCFLDGEHDLDSVRRDSALAMPLVKPNGWFAWHDYGRPGCAVAAVVGALADSHCRKLEVVDSLAWMIL